MEKGKRKVQKAFNYFAVHGSCSDSITGVSETPFNARTSFSLQKQFFPPPVTLSKQDIDPGPPWALQAGSQDATPIPDCKEGEGSSAGCPMATRERSMRAGPRDRAKRGGLSNDHILPRKQKNTEISQSARTRKA
jgi:hypothetical protein